MTRVRLTGLLLLALLLAGAWGAVPRGGGVAEARAEAGQMVSVIVRLQEQADLTRIRTEPRRARKHSAVVALHEKADRTQRPLLALLGVRRAQGQVTGIRPFWIFNGFAMTATPGVIAEIASRPEVASVTPDVTVQAPPAAPASSTPESNVSLVNAPALWGLGYRGSGVVVANMDTGVDVSNPELGPKWRGGTNSWYDPNGQHVSTPTDVSGHGTWTMGVMVGGDAGGTAIGIAPDAKWIAVKIFNDSGSATTSRIHQGFQWLLDPDGNPATADAPDVVNNSWALSGAGCSLEFEQDLVTLRAAGILPVFAAGNYGPNASTGSSPANNPDGFAVGATNNSDVIASFSSRGPSACGETSRTFLELVAPGVSIRSTDLYAGYTSQSGTSLAAPHVAGALALLLGAFPDLSAADQESALETAAADLGAAGPDNTFGYGRLDALASYQWLAARPDFTISSSPASTSTLAGGSVSYTVDISPRIGFSGDVSLSLGGLSASQASWTFTPTPVTGGSGSSQLDISTSSSLAPGSYPLTITGTSGALVHTTAATLVVNPAPDFSL